MPDALAGTIDVIIDINHDNHGAVTPCVCGDGSQRSGLLCRNRSATKAAWPFADYFKTAPRSTDRNA
jgi:hypothetical protein